LDDLNTRASRQASVIIASPNMALGTGFRARDRMTLVR
jgi:hypothetical protein